MNRLAGLAAIVLAVSSASAMAQQTKTVSAPAAKADATVTAATPSDERYAGYYYPKVTSTETYTSEMQTLAGVDRPQRIQFVTVVSQGTLQSTYRVPYAVFAKGDKGDHLIIVGLQAGELNTIYRIRALLANMTTMSRTSPFFQEHTVPEDATFFDLLKLLGFHDVTVTDGDKIAHQVAIK
jgi:hypothetical protein